MSSIAINIGRIKDDLIKIKNKRYDKPYDSSTGLSSDIWSRSEALFEYYTTNKIIDLGLESELIKCSGTEKEEKFVLHRIVKYGLEAVIYKAKYIHRKIINDSDVNLFSDYKIICPPLELEGIKIIDEEHMNGFVDLAQLLRTYLSSHNQSDQPLCIGIFGPPGEGKSFTIKQIIKHVCPERKSDELTLTFNLAQFDSIEQLTEAFHQIQDKVLKHPGEPPLIIFDEFDAKYGTQELGWLKFFLAPMQDDMFHGKSVEYKVGKAIFVFSGGTCKTFQEFNEKFSAKVDEDKRKAVKLTDFIGRLKGFMDVKGINSTGDVISRIVKLRRAIILRSLLKKNAKPIFTTDEKTARLHDKVIDAFIETTNYKFGIRSMEAIIQMSRWIDKEFIPASLPSLEQLEMHIDIQAFKKIKSGGELT